MNKQEFKDLVRSRIVLLDGATGTELMRRGMPTDACPELWVLDNAKALRDLQNEYRQAGSDILYTCTFGANHQRLKACGYDGDVRKINRDLAAITRQAADDSALVFGDIGPSGVFIEPLGDMPFAEAVEQKTAQVKGLLDGGVDGFVVETMIDIQEARAALIAIREACDLPVMASVTLDKHGRCMTGADLEVAVVTLQSLGADAVGCNCSTGPADMIGQIREVKPVTRVPLVAKPNAGMPTAEGGGIDFDMPVDEFAAYVPEYVRRGANILGGCCGTSPEFIAAMKEKAEGLTPVGPPEDAPAAVSSQRSSSLITRGRPLGIIGERINPTGKKRLQAELREGKMDLVRQYAAEQISHGAELLDVNVGAPGVDEADVMAEAIITLSDLTSTPLSIDTTDAESLQRALEIYPGRALVNSISAETPRIEENLPIAARYGAMLVVMPMSDDGMPTSNDQRKAAIETVVNAARQYGYEGRDLVVDGMLMTVSGQPHAPADALDLIEWSDRQLNASTVVGLSNVSFGLPGRQWVNAGFLAMAVARGLTMAIANPMNKLVMASKYTADLLSGRDEHCMEFIRYYRAVLHTHKVVLDEDKEADYEAIYAEEEPETTPVDEHEEFVEETLARRTMTAE